MDKIKKTINRAKTWIKQNPKEATLLIIILIIGAFLRLYRIDEYMTFLGDEGRDVIVVGRFLKEGDLMLVGPGTSIGNMYLGPLYYYMMAPALFLANYSPAGPAIQIALLGIATIFFVWFVGCPYCCFSLHNRTNCYYLFPVFLESKHYAIFQSSLYLWSLENMAKI